MSKHKFRKKSAYSILPRGYCKNCHYEIKQDYRNKRKFNGCNYDTEYNKNRRKLNPICDLEYESRKRNISLQCLINYKKQKKYLREQKLKLKNLKQRLNKLKPKLVKKDSNWYKEYYKISTNSWKELTIDNPNEDALLYRIRYKYDTKFNLKERLRNQLTKQKKKYPNLDYAIRQAASKNQNTKYLNILGYSKEELKNHLEKQFTKDMTWQAFRNGDIHIDHIKPQSLFNLKDINDIKECWSLNNLQPLWAKDNIAKSNKYKER